MGGEDRLRKYVLDNVDRYGHWFRVESHEFSPGVFDIHATVNGVSRWIELKYGTKARPPSFRPTQYAWMRKEIEAGGRPITLVCIHDNDPIFALISGIRSMAIHRETARTPNIEPWIRPGRGSVIWPKKINWNEFLQIVLNPQLLEERPDG